MRSLGGLTHLSKVTELEVGRTGFGILSDYLRSVEEPIVNHKGLPDVKSPLLLRTAY